MAIDSSLYRMADGLAGGNLGELIVQMKGQGESFGRIAKRLYAEHGIDVTAQTVANWHSFLTKCPTCSLPTWHNGDPCPSETAVAS